jgi:hypothetical protein
MLTDNKFLQNVASFVKLASSEIKSAEDKVAALEEELLEFKKKEAAEAIEKQRYVAELRKLADALYDTDFLDDFEKKNFLRKAAEDKIYVARFFGKVCEAADVAQIGKPARVAAKPKEAQYDPVMARAFGHRSESLLDE